MTKLMFMWYSKWCVGCHECGKTTYISCVIASTHSYNTVLCIPCVSDELWDTVNMCLEISPYSGTINYYFDIETTCKYANGFNDNLYLHCMSIIESFKLTKI